jgi:hypothetical protein
VNGRKTVGACASNDRTELSSGPCGRFDALDRVVDGGQQLGTAVRVQAIGVGDESQPCRMVGWLQSAQQPGNGRQCGVGLAPVRVGRQGDVAVDEDQALASVLVDAHGHRSTLESCASDRTKERVDRRGVRVGRTKHMRTGTHDLARVGDPTVELLLGHGRGVR